MTIAGNLRTMELADLLQWLSSGGYTGTLWVGNGTVEKSIFVRDGQIISCVSNEPKEFLGHFLVSRGVISEQELAAAATEQERHRELLGKILVGRGAISQQLLEQMLRLKAEESIYELFRWREGQFRFIDRQLPEQELVPVSLDVTGLVLEGTRRVDEWARMETVIPSLQCVPVAVSDLVEDQDTEAQRAVLALVNDDRSIEELCLQTHSSEFFVCEILFRKAQQGKLKIVRPRIGVAPSAEVATSASALMVHAWRLLEQGEVEPAVRRVRAARNLAPDDPELVKDGKRFEIEVRALLETDGIDPSGVPVLTSALDRLAGMSFSPGEGFILSRINGKNDLASILKISPLPELDALLTVWKLLKAGHIRIEYR